MFTLIPVIVSSALLAASPLDGFQGGEQSILPAQAFSAAAGILGAATACDEIAHDQVTAIARQLGDLAEVKASDLGELASLRRILIMSAAAGRQAIQDGKVDCKTVQASFDQLEQAVLQVEIAFKRE